jgi:geranylgeranyl reductase
MIQTNILIIGGGPAGAKTAKYLSSANIQNVLIQRSFNFKKPCGGGIRKDAFKEFELDEKEIIKDVNEVVLVHKDKKIMIDISNVGLAIVDRVSFDHSLRLEAQHAGTKLLEATFISMKVFQTHIISKIKLEDEYIFVKSNYVVAADGVNSKIRKIINKDEVSSILTHYCDVKSSASTSCDFHFGRDVAQGYYAWAFPHCDGLNIGTVVNSKASLRQLKKNLNLETDAKDFGYKIPIYKNTVFYKDRVFFVGDSASQVLPFTYEGIYYALASAKILSDTIINNKEPKEYEKEWNEKFSKRFRVLLVLQKVFLYNDFMIRVMMKLFSHKKIHKKILELWVGEHTVTVNIAFFVKVLRYMLRKA